MYLAVGVDGERKSKETAILQGRRSSCSREHVPDPRKKRANGCLCKENIKVTNKGILCVCVCVCKLGVAGAAIGFWS